jgi:hypothetical protein
MAGEASAQREKQDQSIKARKKELFVEEQDLQTGPRKKLRDYLKDTPAAPLSKNVKLSLWGSAVPVVLLFIAALFSGGSRSTAKAPDEMIIPQRAKPAPPSLTRRSDDKPPAPAGDTKARDRKDDMAANSDKPPQEKPKAKKKSNKKGKKPKETVVVQNTEGDKANSAESKDKADDKDKANDKDKADDKDKDTTSGDPKKKPKTGSSGSNSKDKMAATDDPKSKSATPEKPKQRAAPIFKKKKAYNPAYPSRTPVGEKKADPKTNPAPDDGTP